MTLAASLKLDASKFRTKSFEIAGHTFKVRVPLTREMDEILKRVVDIPQDVIDARLAKMTDRLRESDESGIEIKDGEILVDGKSVKETVVSVLQMERRITEYFKLLVPEQGDLADLTYEQIEEEFPLQVQFEILEGISQAIQPGYKEARKN